MRSLAILTGFVLGAAAAHAAPPGVNLSWDECGAAGALNRDFACDTNEGSHVLVGSLVAPDVGSQVVLGFSSILDVYAGSLGVPDWWQLQPSTGCRDGSASVSLDFTGMTGCADVLTGRSAGILGFEVIGSRLRIGVSTILTPPQQGTLAPGTDYYLFRLVLDGSETVGPAACAGCLDTARVILTEVFIELQFGYLKMDLPSTRNYVLWQQSVVPVRPTSWSSIKQLYR